MELYQLRTFVTVIEEGSISGAARRLGMTVSSVSGHIKALETELDVVLFVRTHQGVKVTDKGRILADHARQTLNAANELSQQAHALKQQLVGTFRLGVSVSSGAFDVSAFIKNLQSTHPDITLTISHSESVAILEQLKKDMLDMGIVYGQVQDNTLVSHTLGQAELVIAIPAEWSGEVGQTWESLAEVDWIYTGDNCPFQPLIDGIWRTHAIQPHQRVQANNDQTRFDLVCAGLGVSLLERHEANHPKIRVVEQEPIVCDVYLVYGAHRQFLPMIQGMRRLIG